MSVVGMKVEIKDAQHIGAVLGGLSALALECLRQYEISKRPKGKNSLEY